MNYLQKWIDQLRWQRLAAFQKLAQTLLDHLEGILNYCRTKVRFGVVEAIHGNIRSLINHPRGCKNLRSLLLKAQRMAAPNAELLLLKQASKRAWNAASRKFLRRAVFPMFGSSSVAAT